jgi:hypothetical protein
MSNDLHPTRCWRFSEQARPIEALTPTSACLRGCQRPESLQPIQRRLNRESRGVGLRFSGCELNVIQILHDVCRSWPWSRMWGAKGARVERGRPTIQYIDAASLPNEARRNQRRDELSSTVDSADPARRYGCSIEQQRVGPRGTFLFELLLDVRSAVETREATCVGGCWRNLKRGFVASGQL